MLRCALALAALLVAASVSNAATLTVTPDKTSYGVGETITLSIVGDAEGAAAIRASGFLHFDESRVGWQSTSQQALVSGGGALVWLVGGAATRCLKSPIDGPGCAAFDQLIPILQTTDPQTPDNLLLSTMTLTALAPGVVDFTWDTRTIPGLAYEFEFFGATNPQGTSILITPEPGTAALLALGLVQLASLRGSIRRK
jgi:hypothetical protein